MASSAESTLDIPYPSGFYSYQTPALLEYVAAIGGVPPSVASGRRFTYLDLGCGDGFTLNLLAAQYPDSRFIGIDLNPEHVALGTALARDGGLQNVTLIEGGFEEWRRFDLPEFDYVVMHGVWAWISEAARASVIDLIAARLKPGGLAYVSYNAYPGWASVAPLRQFLLDYTRSMGGDTLANVAATIRHLQDLRAKGAAYFKDNPAASGMLDDLLKKDIRYVAHEIYVPYWSPQSFAAVARQMRGASLSFVGSGALQHNYARSSVRAEFLPLLLKESDRERAELHRDYINNTFFRRDVFAKLPADAPRQDPVRLLEAIPFGTTVALADIRRSAPLPEGEMALEGEPFETLRRALAEGAKHISELAALPALRGAPAAGIAGAVQIMATGSQIVPFARVGVPPRPAEDWDIPLALNRRLIAKPIGTDPYLLLVAPALGSVTLVPRDEALVLLAVTEAHDNAADWAWDHAVRNKSWLHAKGVAVTSKGEHDAVFARLRRAVGAGLGKLVEFGTVAPRL
jgi:SAM-dependent methyltransferase